MISILADSTVVRLRFSALRPAYRRPASGRVWPSRWRPSRPRIKMDVFTASWRRYITLLYSAAAAAVTTMMGACRAIVASSRRVYVNDSYKGRSLPYHQSVSSLSSLLLHAAILWYFDVSSSARVYCVSLSVPYSHDIRRTSLSSLDYCAGKLRFGLASRVCHFGFGTCDINFANTDQARAQEVVGVQNQASEFAHNCSKFWRLNGLNGLWLHHMYIMLSSADKTFRSWIASAFYRIHVLVIKHTLFHRNNHRFGVDSHHLFHSSSDTRRPCVTRR